MTRFEIRQILIYCIQHPSSCLRINNVLYAPKLFFINSVLNSLQKKLDNKRLSDDTMDHYLECIVGYINEYYDLSYENDELKIVSHQ
tara:strand:- start:8785 stop:9045 length:261 start_codon:yes stop_codon:yes gene_type:complete